MVYSIKYGNKNNINRHKINAFSDQQALSYMSSNYGWYPILVLTRIDYIKMNRYDYSYNHLVYSKEDDHQKTEWEINKINQDTIEHLKASIQKTELGSPEEKIITQSSSSLEKTGGYIVTFLAIIVLCLIAYPILIYLWLFLKYLFEALSIVFR